MKSLVVASLLLAVPSLASAQDWEWRLDHRNQPSVLVGAAYEHLLVTGGDEADERNEGAGVVDVAFGIPVTDDGGEAFVGVRVGRGGGETRLVAPHLFYRVYAGDYEWKTFFDAGVMLRIEPLVAPSARVGLGAQYDFHENWGAYLAAGASIGYGGGLEVGGDVGAGLQFRFGTAG